MPENTMWTLIISLFIFSLGILYKWIECKKNMEHINKELQDKDQSLNDMQKKYEEKIIELTNQKQDCENKIAEFEKKEKARVSYDMIRPVNYAKNPY